MLIAPVPHRVLELEVGGKKLFGEWFRRLRDPVGQAAIIARLRRIEDTGGFGDYKYLEGGIFELRVPVGPGYRVYFGLQGSAVVLIVLGSDKSSQGRDITRAKAIWSRYLKTLDEGGS